MELTSAFRPTSKALQDTIIIGFTHTNEFVLYKDKYKLEQTIVFT